MNDQEKTPSHSSTGSTLARNKAIVLDFIEQAVNRGNIDAASAHFGDAYIQHNPNIADGVEGFRSYVRQLRQTFPDVRGEVKRIVAEGDYVIVHMLAKRDPKEAGLAIVDIFRLSADKLVEHWEVRQPIAESDLHGNSMI
ncbi:nuclear transport factor 2 family protein [Mesorhizobium silamurunense]|uniref:nuclear transport factor 2 family protein n=1 Tax=Mesorhizobium silamurunense TaxID=499528 RepID=UPI001782332D|nr:nuclear transport factor 2 family protein [Mesorhizobium silamurunense]